MLDFLFLYGPAILIVVLIVVAIIAEFVEYIREEHGGW